MNSTTHYSGVSQKVTPAGTQDVCVAAKSTLKRGQASPLLQGPRPGTTSPLGKVAPRMTCILLCLFLVFVAPVCASNQSIYHGIPEPLTCPLEDLPLALYISPPSHLEVILRSFRDFIFEGYTIYPQNWYDCFLIVTYSCAFGYFVFSFLFNVCFYCISWTPPIHGPSYTDIQYLIFKRYNRYLLRPVPYGFINGFITGSTQASFLYAVVPVLPQFYFCYLASVFCVVYYVRGPVGARFALHSMIDSDALSGPLLFTAVAGRSWFNLFLLTAFLTACTILTIELFMFCCTRCLPCSQVQIRPQASASFDPPLADAIHTVDGVPYIQPHDPLAPLPEANVPLKTCDVVFGSEFDPYGDYPYAYVVFDPDNEFIPDDDDMPVLEDFEPPPVDLIALERRLLRDYVLSLDQDVRIDFHHSRPFHSLVLADLRLTVRENAPLQYEPLPLDFQSFDRQVALVTFDSIYGDDRLDWSEYGDRVPEILDPVLDDMMYELSPDLFVPFYRHQMVTATLHDDIVARRYVPEDDVSLPSSTGLDTLFEHYLARPLLDESYSYPPLEDVHESHFDNFNISCARASARFLHERARDQALESVHFLFPDPPQPVIYDIQPQGGRHPARVPGYRIGDIVVSRRLLRASLDEPCRGLLRPVFVAVMVYDLPLEDRDWFYLTRISPMWRRKMLSITLEPQGVTFSCPRRVTFDFGVRRFLNSLSLVTVDDGSESSSSSDSDVEIARLFSAPPPPAIVNSVPPVLAVVSDDELSFSFPPPLTRQSAVVYDIQPQAWSGEQTTMFIEASQLVLSQVNFGPENLQLRNFLLDSITFVRDLYVATSPLSYLVAIEGMFRKYGFYVETFFEEFRSLPGTTITTQGLRDDIMNNIVNKLLEAVGVAAICMALGITKEFADIRLLGLYMRDNIIPSAKHVLDILVSGLKVFFSGDWSDFSNRVFLMSGDRELTELSKISMTFENMKLEEAVIGSLSARITKLDLLVAQATTLENQAKLYGRDAVSLRVKNLRIRMECTSRVWSELASSHNMRDGPLILVGISRAGSGKSLLSMVLQSALANAVGIPPSEAEHLFYTWAIGEQFQEGFKGHTRILIIDEFLSVNPDYDPNVGPLCNQILQLGSSMPSPIPHAFETKGKYTTEKVLGLVINTNADHELFRTMFSGQAENFYRRVVFVEMLPQGVANVDGQFVPSLIPPADRTKVDDFMKVRVYRMHKGVESPVLSGSVSDLIQYVHSEFVSRLRGESAAIGGWLRSSVRDYVIEKQSLSEFVWWSFILSLLVVHFVPDWKALLYLCAPTEWKLYWFGKRVRVNCLQSVVYMNELCARECVDLKDRLCVLKWKYVYDRALFFMRSRVWPLLLAVTTGVGLYTTVYQRPPWKTAEQERLGVQLDIDAQSFKMPIVPQEVPVGAELREYMGRLVPILESIRGQAVLRPLYAFGTGMRYNELDKLRSNMVRVTVVVDGKPNCVYGMCTGGVVTTVCHVVPNNFVGEFLLEKALVPGQVQRARLSRTSCERFPNEDLSFLSSAMPSGVRDVMACLSSGGGPIIVGDRVLLISHDVGLDMHGTVIDAYGIGNYEVDSGVLSHVPIFSVRWDSGETVAGDCGRWCVRTRGGGYSLEGFCVGVAKDKPVPGVSMMALCDAPALKARVSAAKQSIGVLRAINITPQATQSLEYPIPDVLFEPPTQGIFAYPQYCTTFNVEVIGRMSRQSPPAASRLVRSPFHAYATDFLKEHCEDIKFAPAVQTNVIRYDTQIEENRFVSPYEVALDRAPPGGALLDLDACREFGDTLFHHMSAYIKPFRVLTVDEALERREDLAPVDPTKASVLPDGGKKGEYMYEVNVEGETMRVADERLRTACHDMIVREVQGEVGFLVCRESLKDEVVPEKKIIAVKTRTFAACASDGYLVNRMYYGGMIPFLLLATRSLGICIGVNASSSEWNWVDKRTNPDLCGGTLEGIDFSRFDKNFVFMIHMVVLDVLYRLFLCGIVDTPGAILEAAGRHLLREVQAVRIVDGAIVLAYAGNCSGSFWTTIVNSLVNVFYNFLAYRTVIPAYPSSAFVKDVLAFCTVYGDDLRKVFRDKRVTVDLFRGAMLVLGQTITSSESQKGDLIADTGGGRTFLKRGFRRVHDRVYCPLEVTSIVKSLLYYQPSGDPDQDWKRHASTLVSVWDESFFHNDVVKGKLRELLGKCFLLLPERLRGQALRSDAELSARWEAGAFKIWQL